MTVEVNGAQRQSENAQTAIQFVVDTVGGTPTVTWQVSGSLDGTNWYPVNYVTDASDTAAVTAIASTAVGAKVIYLANAPSRQYRYFRVVTTLNTNVTYHVELYAFGYQVPLTPLTPGSLTLTPRTPGSLTFTPRSPGSLALTQRSPGSLTLVARTAGSLQALYPSDSLFPSDTLFPSDATGLTPRTATGI